MDQLKDIDQISAYYEGRGGYRGPYVEYEKLILASLGPDRSILDVGCGRTFLMASKWLESGAYVCGIDPVIDSNCMLPGVKSIRGKAEKIDCSDNQFDLIVSCAVFEHLVNPLECLKEFYRVLKPGGKVIILAPSKYDYVSIASWIVPNKFHGWIVKKAEGRRESDTFPAYYLANSRKDLRRLTDDSGFTNMEIAYYDQSPSYLKFNSILYKIGCSYHKLIRSFQVFDPLKGWILCAARKP